MSNVGRVLTIRIKIVGEEAAKTIWNVAGENLNDKDRERMCGCDITALADGDTFAERDHVQRIAEKYVQALCEEGSNPYGKDEPCEVTGAKTGEKLYRFPLGEYASSETDLAGAEVYYESYAKMLEIEGTLT